METLCGKCPSMAAVADRGCRTIRHQVVAQGTSAVLDYLRGGCTALEVALLTGCQVVRCQVQQPQNQPNKTQRAQTRFHPRSPQLPELGVGQAAAILQEMDLKIGQLEDQVVQPGLSGPKVHINTHQYT